VQGAGAHYLSLRPEKLERRAPRAGEIGLEVRLAEAVFLGDMVEYSATHGAGTQLHFRERRSSGADLPARGDHVSLAFRPEDAVLVPDR
jgi:putative spermidine/putrescine transport system ATP-binding protein